MRMLVITSNTNFLDWVKKYPYEANIFKFNLNVSRTRKALFWSTLKPRLKILSWKYDVIFCDWFEEHASIMSKISSKPIYVRLHRYEAHNPIHLKNAKLENIKCIITVSNYYKQIVNEIINGKVPIQVIPNGVDTEKFTFNPIIHSPMKICTVGNLNPRKRIFDLIINNPDLEINIGGNGIEKLTLQNTIKRFDLKAKLHGFVKLPEFYHQHDIFIINSSDESFGVALVEAMSCGLIPLSFARPEAEEILPKEYLYYNYEEMRDKIFRLKQMSQSEVAQIKRDVRSIVESKYSLELQVKNFISIFKT